MWPATVCTRAGRGRCSFGPTRGSPARATCAGELGERQASRAVRCIRAGDATSSATAPTPGAAPRGCESLAGTVATGIARSVCCPIAWLRTCRALLSLPEDLPTEAAERLIALLHDAARLPRALPRPHPSVRRPPAAPVARGRSPVPTTALIYPPPPAEAPTSAGGDRGNHRCSLPAAIQRCPAPRAPMSPVHPPTRPVTEPDQFGPGNRETA